MTTLSADPRTRFIGYGVRYPGRGGGTLSGVPVEQCLEFPTAEHLMMSAAVGLSLRGYRPIVYFERMDFLCLALDVITNQLDSIAKLSRGQFKPACIIRVVVGNSGKPLFTGLTHTRDLSNGVSEMVRFRVVKLDKGWEDVNFQYGCAYNRMVSAENPTSTMLVEYKDVI